MSMGGPGDHPIGDLIFYDRNPFPADVADLVRQLYALDPKMRDTFALDAFDWVAGRGLDAGRAKLRAGLQKHKSKG
jgi:hypothetical protein